MNQLALVLTPLSIFIVLFFFYWRFHLRSSLQLRNMFSTLIPGWRFFSHIGHYPYLLIFKAGGNSGTRILSSPKNVLFGLFCSAQSNHDHYLRSLLENLIELSQRDSSNLTLSFEYNYLQIWLQQTYPQAERVEIGFIHPNHNHNLEQREIAMEFNLEQGQDS